MKLMHRLAGSLDIQKELIWRAFSLCNHLHIHIHVLQSEHSGSQGCRKSTFLMCIIQGCHESQRTNLTSAESAAKAIAKT